MYHTRQGQYHSVCPIYNFKLYISINSTVFYWLQSINTRSCNYSCTSCWWWLSTAETCRAAYKNVMNWIQSHLVGQLLNDIHDARTHAYIYIYIYIYIKTLNCALSVLYEGEEGMQVDVFCVPLEGKTASSRCCVLRWQCGPTASWHLSQSALRHCAGSSVLCKVSTVKPTRCTRCIKFIFFWNDTLHVSDGLSSHHQQFKTVHRATVTDSSIFLT